MPLTTGTDKLEVKARILLVEDDPSLVFGLRKNLELEGYEVMVATDGETGLQRAVDEKPDLIILDIMLPKVNGFEICEILRKHEIATPVIFLSAKSQEIDKVMGLDLGGDDYMTKPFSVRELMARVRTILRRVKEDPDEPAVFGELQIDFKGRSVSVRGEEVLLTSREFELLRFLVHRQGNVLSRETILKKVWGFDYYGTARTIDNFINRLRQKIEDDPERPRYIVTVRGVGYKFSP